MKTSSMKAKGRRLAKLVQQELLNLFNPEFLLTDKDIRITPSGVTGPDLQLSEAASDLLPYAFECKNQEKLNLRQAWEQAEANNKDGIPILIHAKNRTNPLVTMSLQTFLQFIHIEKTLTLHLIKQIPELNKHETNI